MLEDLLNFAKDIGFTQVLNYSNTPDLIFLSYGYYTIAIYNPEEHKGFEKRYSLELKKNDINPKSHGTYITTGEKKINFALDDFEVLETEFKDVIRDNKLKKILRDV